MPVPGGPPEHERTGAAGLDQHPQRLACTEQVGLAVKLIQAPWAHALGQGCPWIHRIGVRGAGGYAKKVTLGHPVRPRRSLILNYIHALGRREAKQSCLQVRIALDL